MRPICRDLVRRGWAAWNIEYRRLGGGQGGGWPATFDDVAAAIDALPEGRRSPLDLERRRVPGTQRGRPPGAVGRRDVDAARAGACARVRVVAQAPIADLERGRLPSPARPRAARAGRRRSRPSAMRRPVPARQIPLAVAGAARPRRGGRDGHRRSRAATTRRRRGPPAARSSSSSRRAGTATTSTRVRPRGRRSPRARPLAAEPGVPILREPWAATSSSSARTSSRTTTARCATTCSSTSARRSPSVTRRATTS